MKHNALLPILVAGAALLVAGCGKSAEFKKLAEKYDFITVNGNRSITAVDRDLRAQIEQILAKEYPAGSKS